MNGAGTTWLGVISAMALEGGILAGRPVSPGEFVHLRKGAFLMVCGTGPERAGLAALRMIKNGAAALVSWGTAAGLKPGLVAGSIIIPEEVLIPHETAVQADPVWRSRLCGRLEGRIAFFGGALAGSVTVLSRPEAKKSLFDSTGAIASDMESAAICSAARNARLPFIAIRAVTDPVDLTVPRCAASAADRSGKVLIGKLLYGLLRKPGDLRSIIRLARNFQEARRSLKSVAALGGGLFCLNEDGD